MEKSFTYSTIKFFDSIEEKIRKVIYYKFLSQLLTSFLIGGLIPVIFYLLSSDDGFISSANNNSAELSKYGLILMLVWISIAFYLIRIGYSTLDEFLEKFKKSGIKYNTDDIRNSFYDDKKLLISFVIIFALLTPILYNMYFFYYGFNLLFFIFCSFSVIFYGPFGLYFMFNAVDIISRITKSKNKEIELFHYDKMGGIRFLAIFSNITSLLWFSSSLCIPIGVEVLKPTISNFFIQYSIFLVVIIVGIWAFLYPQFLIRQRSIEIKSSLINDANSIIEKKYFKDKTKILELSSEDREKIIFYNENYVKKIEDLKVWPFDISGLLGFIGSVFIPIVVSFITFLLKIN